MGCYLVFRRNKRDKKFTTDCLFHKAWRVSSQIGFRSQVARSISNTTCDILRHFCQSFLLRYQTTRDPHLITSKNAGTPKLWR